jgi:hypothetical protein
MEPNDRHEVADYLQNEAANCQDAELGDKLMEAADVLRSEAGTPMPRPSANPASVRFSVEAMWIGESRFPEGHPSSLMNDINGAFAEATSDSLIVIDNLAAVDLTQAREDWRLAMVESLRRDLDHVTTLYRNAMQIATTLTFEEG